MTTEKLYHIHIDATFISEAFRRHLHKEGFVDADFAGHPHGYMHFEPNAHMTLKLDSKSAFREAFRRTSALCGITEKMGGFMGYIEGEYVISDVRIPEKPFDLSVPFPFYIVRRRLEEREGFRQTEFHLVLDKDASDPQLITNLLEAGLYGAYIQKKDWTGLVLTMQGSRADIDRLTGLLHGYLLEAGGAVRATLQEERAIAYRLFGVQPRELPEVADRLSGVTDDMRSRGRELVRKMRGFFKPANRVKMTQG